MIEWLQLSQQQAADHGSVRFLWGSAANKEDLPPWLFWTYLGVSIGLVSMAGLMSGLTLGLMSLDELDLEVLKRSGTEQEKKHARRIMPVIENEHLLLVTLLLFNALSTEALPIFLDKLVDPVTAVLLSVTVVLVVGEIVPQAVCKSYGLQVGSYSAFFVRLLMLVGAPVAWPIGKLLDRLLGDEQTALFRRAQLKALVGLHSSAEGLGGNLSADEISIITGALDLTSKTACTAMTPLDKVFMLPSDRRLDEATLQDVLISGHSRVPVHAPGERRKLLGLILVKELVLVDPEEGVTAGQLVSRSLPRLPADMPMYQLLRLFEAGGSHMVALTRPATPRPSLDDIAAAAATNASAAAVTSSPNPRPSSTGPIGPLGVSRTSSASGAVVGSNPLHRIKSGVIKTGDSMVYIEAEQRAPLSPQGSWGTVGTVPQGQQGQHHNAANYPQGWGTVHTAPHHNPHQHPHPVVVGSPIKGGGGGGLRDSSGGEGTCAGVLWGPDVKAGDPVGIITIEDVIEELLQQEIIDETDQYVDNLQVTRVDAYNLTTSLPPRLRKAYAQQFTPRVGRLVVHHPSHHHSHGPGSWKGLTVLKQQQIAPRGAYSNPTTPLAGSPDSSILASPMSALAAFSSSSHPHSRLSGESAHHAAAQHMQQVPEQQQLRVGTPGDEGLHNLGLHNHGLRHGAAHLPTQSHQHVPHIPAALLRRGSAEAAVVNQAASSLSSASVPTPGVSLGHSSSSSSSSRVASGSGASGVVAKGGTGSSSAGRAGGFGSVVKTDGLKTPLLAGCGDEDSDTEQQ